MKNISFKKVFLLIKNNYIINRSLPSILFLLVSVLGGIVGALPVSDLEMRYDRTIYSGFATHSDYLKSIRELFEDMLGINGVFSIMFMIITIVLAFLSVITMTGYLREKSANDFYHALSFNRNELYLANSVTAFINGAVTIIFSQFIGLFFMNLIAKEPPLTLIQTLWAQLPVLGISLLYLALFISIAMLSSILSGSVFSTLVTFAFINFYIPATILAVSVSGNQLFNSNLMDLLEHKPHAYFYTSPYIRYIMGVSDKRLPFGISSVILIVIATLALTLLGMWLYSKKKNENSLKTVAFTFVKRPLQYLIAFDAILLGATFFEAITSSFVWCISGGLIALLFTFIFTNAYFDKSFQGVMKNARHISYILIISLLFGAIFVADAFRIYKEVEPDIDNIEGAYLYINLNEKDESSSHYDFNFTNDTENDRSGKAHEIDDDVKDALASLWTLIEEKNASSSYSNQIYVEKYPDTAEILSYVSVSLNINCKDDFGTYYKHLYLDEKDEYYEKIMVILNEFINSYSHYYSYYNHTTGDSENFTVIK